MEAGTFLILIVLFWLASPVVNCIIASGKGFGAVGWFLLGLNLSLDFHHCLPCPAGYAKERQAVKGGPGGRCSAGAGRPRPR